MFTWSKSAIKKLARQFKSRSEFKKKASGAYHAAKKHGCLDEVCAHMIKGVKHAGYWDSKKLVLEEAKKYSTRLEFKKKASAALASSIRNGWYKEACAHMSIKSPRPRGYWAKSKCQKLALKYRYKSDFQKKEKAAYAASYKNKWIDDICSHMVQKIKPRNFWNKINIENAALKCETRTEFREKYTSAYKVAKENDWLDEVCRHMRKTGLRKKRGLYAFEFQDHSVYIGLTADYKARYSQHLNRNKYLINKIKNSQFQFIPYNVFYDQDIAAIKEGELIEQYRMHGWTILNRAKAGALGGNTLKWDMQSTAKEAAKYDTKKEFELGSPGAYSSALKNKWIEQICNHMPKRERLPNGFWDEFHKVKTEALKYETREEFKRKSAGAYRAAVKYKWLPLVCSHMAYLTRRSGYWNDKNLVHREALKYSSKFEFQKGSSSAYGSAKRNGWLKDVCKHMLPKSKPAKYWNNFSRVSVAAKKCKTRSEFAKKYAAAYDNAQKNGWLEKVCVHMENKHIWTKGYMIQLAKNCLSRAEFARKYPSGYSAISKNGWGDEVFSHLPRRNKFPIGHWDKYENVLAEAMKYKTRSSFKDKSKGAYGGAIRNKWLNLVCAHMS